MKQTSNHSKKKHGDKPEIYPPSDDYSRKFETFASHRLYVRLKANQRDFIQAAAFAHKLTFQEFLQVVGATRDLEMWGEGNLQEWWSTQTRDIQLAGMQQKKRLMQNLRSHLEQLKRIPKVYPEEGLPTPAVRNKGRVKSVHSDKTIHGMCPVASEETVCCNLKTIDAVENCAFGCSYCTIQTFYRDEFIFDANFAQKLRAIPIEPDKFYHFGTGQSSDSLIWGNKNGNLDALFDFARDHPNILLEFKTKSNNIRYFLENQAPPNVVCSWSLNTKTIIRNEEHFTASLEQRIEAARQLADRGVKVAFHFHPMVYYDGWQQEYPELAERLLALFQPEQVLFISMGSITMISPAIKKIRELGQFSKILQMEMVPDPHGKLTYPDETKIKMFKTMHRALAGWHKKVFMYLCMEKASIWRETFGFAYPTNEEFELEFGRGTMPKLDQPHREANCLAVVSASGITR